jgi:hypothetical protein
MEVGCQQHTPAALPLGKTPSTHWTGGWVQPPGPVWMGVENPAPTVVFHEQYKFYIILQYAPLFSVLQQHFLQHMFTIGRERE